MTDGFKAPPISGYTDQPQANAELVNTNKQIEERLLRALDSFMTMPDIDKRWCAIARAHFEEGFMALNRSIFKPQRIKLPEDTQ